MLIVQPIPVKLIPYGPSNVLLVLPDFFTKKICPEQNLYTICFTLAYLSTSFRYFQKNYQQCISACPGQSDPERASFIIEHMEDITMIKRQYIDINEVIESYLPMSKKKARKFVIRYLDHKWIGNKIYVDRIKLEELLKREDVESFPLD